MDLRAYYGRLRETEKGFREEFVVVKSVATPDGGIAGRLTEVSRAVAAKMIVDGMAQAADAAEAAAHRRAVAESKEREEERREAAQVQITLTGSKLREFQGKRRRGRKR
jgi:hypothetical protein